MEKVVVIKLNLAGQETWRYSGEVLTRDAHSLTIRALFNRADTPFHGITLRSGDPFIEIYFNNRWYQHFPDPRPRQRRNQGLVLQRHPPGRVWRGPDPLRGPGPGFARLPGWTPVGAG